MVSRDPLDQSRCTKGQPYTQSQLEAIIENPGNMWGEGGGGGGGGGGRTRFWSLVRRWTKPGISSSAMQARIHAIHIDLNIYINAEFVTPFLLINLDGASEIKLWN